MATRTDTDDFNRANANPISGNWIALTSGQPCQISGNRVRGTVVNAGGNDMRSTLPMPADQTSKITLVTWGAGGQFRVSSRCGTSSYQMYQFLSGGSGFGTNGCVLVKFVSGSYTEIGTGQAATFAVNSVMACDSQGSTIRGLVDSVQKYSVSDSSLTSGYPGLGILFDGTAADLEIDNWSAEGVGYPVVINSANSSTAGATATATPAISLPSNLVAGNLLVAIFRCSLAGAIGWPANWNEIADNATDSSANQTAIAWKACLGTEGATATLSCTSSKFSALVWQIYYADTATAPELSTIATGTSTAPNPTAVTPSGGSKDYLILSLGGWEGEQTSPPAVPTNYNDVVGSDSGTAGAITTNTRVAGAWRHVTGTTEDPPAWTISVSDDWTAYALAVYPKVVSGDVTTAITTTASDVAVGSVTASGGDVGETGRTSIATDTFNRADEDPITGNWVSLNDFSSRIKLVSNKITATHSNPAHARWVGAGTFTNDQYSSLVLGTSGTASRIGAVVRSSGDADSARDYYSYEFRNDTSQTELVKTVNGSISSLNLTTSVSWTNGDRIEIEAEGTTIRGLKTLVQQISVTDSSLTTGLPGVMGIETGGMTGDDWDGGSISEVEVTFKSAWARNANQLVGVGAR